MRVVSGHQFEVQSHQLQVIYVGGTRDYIESGWNFPFALVLLDMSSKTFHPTFGLWELAKHCDCQEKLRAEIDKTLAKVKARGDPDFTANDFGSVPYLVAITRVRRIRLSVRLNEGKFIKSFHRKL